MPAPIRERWWRPTGKITFEMGRRRHFIYTVTTSDISPSPKNLPVPYLLPPWCMYLRRRFKPKNFSVIKVKLCGNALRYRPGAIGTIKFLLQTSDGSRREVEQGCRTKGDVRFPIGLRVLLRNDFKLGISREGFFTFRVQLYLLTRKEQKDRNKVNVPVEYPGEGEWRFSVNTHGVEYWEWESFRSDGNTGGNLGQRLGHPKRVSSVMCVLRLWHFLALKSPFFVLSLLATLIL